MGANRLFWPQEMMDEWIVDEKAVIDEEILTISEENKKYHILQAVHFVADVGDGDDPFKLVGKVKEVEALEEMGAEHYMDSVIIEDSAYEVVQGFTGLPESVQASTEQREISQAIKTQTGETDSEDKDLLADFLLNNL